MISTMPCGMLSTVFGFGKIPVMKRSDAVLLRFMRWFGHQKWVGKAHGVLSLFAAPENIDSIAFDVDFFGKRYRGDLSSHIDWNVFFFGAYAYNELLLLARVAERMRGDGRNVVFYDIGANVGQHALFMSSHAAEIFAFEPMAELAASAREKFTCNGIANAKVFDVALGRENGEFDFYPPTGRNLGLGSLVKENACGSAVLKVPVRRGDDFVATAGLPLPSLIKIDVEGAEADVLAGLSNVIRHSSPVILMEMSQVTRQRFGSFEAFKRCFYDGVGFKSVGGNHRIGYILSDFDFDDEKVCEVIAFPQSMSEFFDGLRRRRAPDVAPGGLPEPA